MDGARDFRVVVPVNWTNGSKHELRVKIAPDAGPETSYKAEGTAPGVQCLQYHVFLASMAGVLLADRAVGRLATRHACGNTRGYARSLISRITVSALLRSNIVASRYWMPYLRLMSARPRSTSAG